MKTIRIEWVTAVPLLVLISTLTLAQVPAGATLPSVKSPASGAITDPSQTPPGQIKDTVFTAGKAATDTAATLPEAQLDKAVDALNKGDKAGSAQALQAGIAGLEAEVQQKPTSFKDKVLSQVGSLKTLLPLITGGGLGGGVLQKAVGLTKLASGANRLESLMSMGSLIGNAGKLTSSLSGLGSAMSVLGGKQSAGQSLISTALSGVSKLSGGGAMAKAAEPAVKSQLGSVLNFVKGAL
jgi:hypothetical protein